MITMLLVLINNINNFKTLKFIRYHILQIVVIETIKINFTCKNIIYGLQNLNNSRSIQARGIKKYCMVL